MCLPPASDALFYHLIRLDCQIISPAWRWTDVGSSLPNRMGQNDLLVVNPAASSAVKSRLHSYNNQPVRSCPPLQTFFNSLPDRTVLASRIHSQDNPQYRVWLIEYLYPPRSSCLSPSQLNCIISNDGSVFRFLLCKHGSNDAVRLSIFLFELWIHSSSWSSQKTS